MEGTRNVALIVTVMWRRPTAFRRFLQHRGTLDCLLHSQNQVVLTLAELPDAAATVILSTLTEEVMASKRNLPAMCRLMEQALLQKEFAGRKIASDGFRLASSVLLGDSSLGVESPSCTNTALRVIDLLRTRFIRDSVDCPLVAQLERLDDILRKRKNEDEMDLKQQKRRKCEDVSVEEPIEGADCESRDAIPHGVPSALKSSTLNSNEPQIGIASGDNNGRISSLDDSQEKDHTDIKEADHSEVDTAVVKNKQLTESAMQLRASLLQDPHTAISDITELLQRAGKESGVEGIALVGSVLSYGHGPHPCSDNRLAASKNNVLSDATVSSLADTYLNEATSTLRTKTFLQWFVLPLVVRMDPVHPASRVLLSFLTALAREHQTIAVETILIPALCCANTNVAATRSRCELISRIVKSNVLTKECLVSLFMGIVRNVPTWTEEPLLLVLSSCLHSRPPLSDPDLLDFVHGIELNAKNLCQSVKFSVLLQTVVTNYGFQLKKTSCVDTLLRVSEQITIFLGKTIATSLKKL